MTQNTPPSPSLTSLNNPPLSQPSSTTEATAERLLTLVERTTRAGAWTFDLTSRTLTRTRPLADLLELPHGLPLTTLNADPLVLYAPEARDRMNDMLQRCLNDGLPFDVETLALTHSGERLWVRSRGQALLEAGEVVCMQGVLQDLSRQKLAAQDSLHLMMRLSTTLASITDAFATLDRDGRLTYVSPQTERLLAMGSERLLGCTLWQAFDPPAAARLRSEIEQALNSGQPTEIEAYFAPVEKWLELRAYPFDEGLAVYLRDVTERRRSQEQLLLLQTSISRLNDIVLITEAGSVDKPGPRIVFVNDAFERLTGYSCEEVLGHSPRMLQGPATQRSELDKIRAALEASRPVRAELINYKKNGEQFWLELDIVPVDYFSRGLTHWVAVARDITARKLADDEIEHLAFYDVLTQLPNRQLLMERLQLALRKRTNTGAIGALMFIDLDHFKVLNDTLGHAKGDLLLQKVAKRLLNSVRREDTVARLGGDEFVVMLEDLSADTAEATEKSRAVGQKILAGLSEPYDLAGHAHHGTCSVGITLFSHDHESIGDLLKQADLAMYQAKGSGRNAVCFFDPQMQAAATASAALNAELRQALRDEEFVLHYQPQVGRDGRMVGVEALLRWQQPDRVVLPDDFIGQAEESGLILPLGEWALRTACEQLAAWGQREETAHLSIAVNVSVRQFRHPEFVELVMRLIEQAGIRADRLKLELTESLLATDISVTIAKMGMLKEAGVTLSIDDFGMGYSALSYLKHMPLDQLKIDRNFVKDVLTDPNDAAIARTIIGLAQSLGLAVMAEGVETEAQRDFLNRHGCDNYQGFLFCRPLPIDELEAFMSKRLRDADGPANDAAAGPAMSAATNQAPHATHLVAQPGMKAEQA